MYKPMRLIASVLVAASALCMAPASAQDYPSRLIKFVIADSPGTNSDTLGRFFGAELSKALGQAVVIENRPGASYRIGWEYGAKQAPDGYTIVLVNIPGIVSLPLISKEMRLDPLKDLPPVMGIGEGRITVTVPANAPFKTFNELIAVAKASPGKLNYGTSGVISRLPMEALKKTFGVDIVMVPYKAGNLYIQGLVTGEVQAGVVGEQTAMNFGDRVRVLAVSGSKRVPQWPNTPTFTETGMPTLVGNYFILSTPAGVPKAITDRLYAAGQRALQTAEMKSALEKLKFEPVPISAEATARTLAEQSKLYAELGKAAGILPE